MPSVFGRDVVAGATAGGGLWALKQIARAVSAATHSLPGLSMHNRHALVDARLVPEVGLSPSIGYGHGFLLNVEACQFYVLIQSAAPSSREQTVPSAAERELLLQ